MGQLIEFYKPTPKPVVEAEPEESKPAVAETLKHLLNDCEHMQDIVVLIKTKYDTVGIVSTMEGPAENVLFIERVKAKLVSGIFDDAPETPNAS